MMRVLQVIPYLNPMRGGDVSVCCKVSEELSRKGHSITILTSDFELDTTKVKDLEEVGVEVVVFACTANLALFIVTPSMNEWLKENMGHFDLVHLHDFRTYQNVIVMKQARRHGVPYILHPHGSMRRTAGKERLKLLFDIVWGRRILNCAAHVIAVSKQECRDVNGIGFPMDRISVVYNGIDIERYASQSPPGAFKKKHGIDGRVLLYVGRIHKSKGIDVAIQAFAGVACEFDDVTMVVCGRDEGHRQQLFDLAVSLRLENRVLFLDFLDEDEKLEAYANAHLFFHTVRYMGGVGLAPLEAVMCCTPVVVTKECSEVIEDAHAGYVTEQEDVDAISHAFRTIIRDSTEGRKRAQDGRDYLVRHFAWRNVISRVELIYSEVRGRM